MTLEEQRRAFDAPLGVPTYPPTVRHHPDCDGWRTEHRCTVERIRHTGGRHVVWTYRAVCDGCGPIHAGTFGQAALDACHAQANGHSKEVPCDGRCLAWTDPEYADVDETGQLALGVAGDQRAIPGLAKPRKES